MFSRFVHQLLAAAIILLICACLPGCASERLPASETAPPLQKPATATQAARPTATRPTVTPALLETGTPSPASPVGDLSTPELIDAARQRGEITPGQRWLYLAYAIYDYEALPAAYRSKVRWDGTLYLRDLKQVVASPESMCALEPEVQAELRRLLPGAAACAP